MATYNKRVEFTKEKLLDNYERRDSLLDFIYGVVRFLGIIVQNIYCVSSYLVLSWILLFPISWVRSDLYSKIENYLYNSLLFIVSSWSLAAGLTVVETGDEYKHLIEDPESVKTALFSKRSHVEKRPNGFNNSATGKQVGLTSETGFNLKPKETNGDLLEWTNHIFDNSQNLNPKPKKQQCGDVNKSLNITDQDLNRTNEHKDATSSCPNESNCNNNNYDYNFIKQLNNSDLNITKSITANSSLGPTDLNNETIRLNNSSVKKPRILLLCNHVSTADVPLIMQSFSTLTKQSLLWVLDAQFKPTNFGLVCISHGDFFIAKDSFTDGSLKDQVLKHPDRNLLVLFPEGGFWRKRLEGSNRYALKNGLPMTKYVTHPRFGAFKDLIDPSVDVTHIVDATLLYDDIKNPLSILDIALGNRKEPAILNFKVYERDKINPTEEWLRNIWLEKDKLLQQYYEDRGRVYERFEASLRAAKLDWFKVLSVHLFYLSVCYLTIYRLFSATSITMLKAREFYYSNI